MRIVDLAEQPEKTLEIAAKLLVEEFDERYGWPTIALARDEVRRVISEGFARAMIDRDFLLGWVGGLPEYGGRVWELHPLVVQRDYRRRGIGRRLVEAFEAEARNRGAHTATLGTDDTSGMTSLGEIDLYTDIPGHIRAVRELGKSHPFLLPEAWICCYRRHARCERAGKARHLHVKTPDVRRSPRRCRAMQPTNN